MQVPPFGVDELLLELNGLANNKESILDICDPHIRNQLMKEIGLLRKSYFLIRQLNKMRLAYEEIIEVKWDFDHKNILPKD